MAADTGCTINLANSSTPLLLEQPTPHGISITSASCHSMRAISKGYSCPSNYQRMSPNAIVFPNFKPLYYPLARRVTAMFTSTQMQLLQNQDVDIQLKNKPTFTGHQAANGL